MQDFELEPLSMGGDHSLMVKAPPIEAIMAQKIASLYHLELPFLD